MTSPVWYYRDIEGEGLKLMLKSLSVRQCSCQWEAMKAVCGQMERVLKAMFMFTLSLVKGSKSYAGSRALFTAILYFYLGVENNLKQH